MTDITLTCIAVLRTLKLGRLMCALPAVRALRRAWPLASITLIGLPWAAGFAKRFSRLVDRFIEFPGYPGLPERRFEPRAFPAFLQQVQRQRFDVAVQMHGPGSIVNEIVHLFDASATAGFYEPGSRRPEGTWIPYPENEREIFRNPTLTSALGARAHGHDCAAYRQHEEGRIARLSEQYLLEEGQ